jgi:hypothetical protein
MNTLGQDGRSGEDVAMTFCSEVGRKAPRKYVIGTVGYAILSSAQNVKWLLAFVPAISSCASMYLPHSAVHSISDMVV